jgi:DNA invertase Pin-like site-specific DNA recombinase
VVDDKALRRIRANRRKNAETDAELPQLVRDAFDAGHTWQQIAKELGVGKARVYQLRASDT